MRVTTAASAALAVALSGSLALGAAGTAFAGTAPAHPASPHAAAPRDAETTQEQFRVIERAGQLTETTGVFGRMAAAHDVRPQQLRPYRKQLRDQVRRLRLAVDAARAGQRHRPGRTDRPQQHRASFDRAARGFDAAVREVIGADRTNARARAAASNSLLRTLSLVNAAAMSDAGIQVKQQPAHRPQRVTSTRSAGEALPDLPDAFPFGDMGILDVFHSFGDAGSTTRYRNNFVYVDRRDVGFENVSDVTDAVSDLVDAVLHAPGGRLSAAEYDRHRRALDKAFAPLREKAARSTAGQSTARQETAQPAEQPAAQAVQPVVQLREGANKLLRSSVGGGVSGGSLQPTQLLGDTVDFLTGLTGLGSSQASGGTDMDGWTDQMDQASPPAQSRTSSSLLGGLL